MLDSMNDAVFVTSPDGLIKRVNLAATQMLGWSQMELLGRELAYVISDQDRPTFNIEQATNEVLELTIRTQAGQTIPVSLSGSVMSAEDPRFQGCIFVARNITERKRAERRIRYLARYDTLTKIPNRLQFQHSLQQAIARTRRAGRELALIYLDLDRFKEVNDTFGHAAGDRALEILSERMNKKLPRDTMLGRLAGDEFALFVENLPAATDNRAAIGALARELLDELGRPFQLNQHELYVTGSIGIALCPRDADNVVDLIRDADAAMYYSKQNGGNSHSFFTPEMSAAAVERLMLKAKLRRAVERDELVILYQPKVDLRDGRVVGGEALIRWRLPGHGDISPAQFIPLAEESNLIQEIGEWVLKRVVRDYRSWQEQVPKPGPHLHQPVAQAAAPGRVPDALPLGVRRRRRRAVELRAGDHRDHPDDRGRAAWCACSTSCTRWGCTCPSTTSAPATRRCRRCSSSRSARSRSTSPSCATRPCRRKTRRWCARSSRWARTSTSRSWPRASSRSSSSISCAAATATTARAGCSASR